MVTIAASLVGNGLCDRSATWAKTLSDRLDALVRDGDLAKVHDAAEALESVVLVHTLLRCGSKPTASFCNPGPREDPPADVGRAAGGLAAGAAVTAVGLPELVPIAAPLGAAGGELLEKEIRKQLR